MIYYQLNSAEKSDKMQIFAIMNYNDRKNDSIYL
jgi:hypothetical protein